MNILEQDPVLQQAIDCAGPHLAKVIRTMVEGVAFPVLGNNKLYICFSHEGEELGLLQTQDVNYAISYMKRRGRAVGKNRGYGLPNQMPAYTFGWVGWDWERPQNYGHAVQQNFLKGVGQ